MALNLPFSMAKVELLGEEVTLLFIVQFYLILQKPLMEGSE
jgi:hypothetical protein